MFSPLLCAIALVFSSTLVTAAPSAETLAKRAPAQVITKCTVPNTVALTFDDGPYLYMYDVGKKLAEYGGKATFFLNGNNWGCAYTEDNTKRIKWAYDKGHQLASHTWSHTDLTKLGYERLHHQFWLVEDLISKVTGATPAFARPPFGNSNDLVRQVAGERGQDLVMWDFDSGDTWGIGPEAVKQRYNELANRNPKPNTMLTLNHDVHETTAHNVLNHIVPMLKNKGYNLVTVAECLGRQPYQRVIANYIAVRNSTWTCSGKPGPGAP